jgi:hypothetical protein
VLRRRQLTRPRGLLARLWSLLVLSCVLTTYTEPRPGEWEHIPHRRS